MKRIVSVATASLVILGASAATAQVKDQTFKDWTVYTTTLQGQKACYMASYPTSKTGNYKNRDEPYFLVTKVGKNTYEVSVSSGYGYKDNGDVQVDIDGGKFNMFTKGELAWASDSKQDSQMIERMKAKGSMNVRGSSQKGTYSVDKYSLSGFSSAFKRMNEVCG